METKVLTVEKKLENTLKEHGMSEEQAKSVMEIAKPELINTVDGYTITLQSQWDEYPAVIYNILFASIKPIALKWIDNNKPMAWFRNMFI